MRHRWIFIDNKRWRFQQDFFLVFAICTATTKVNYCEMYLNALFIVILYLKGNQRSLPGYIFSYEFTKLEAYAVNILVINV